MTATTYVTSSLCRAPANAYPGSQLLGTAPFSRAQTRCNKQCRQWAQTLSQDAAIVLPAEWVVRHDGCGAMIDMRFLATIAAPCSYRSSASLPPVWHSRNFNLAQNGPGLFVGEIEARLYNTANDSAPGIVSTVNSRQLKIRQSEAQIIEWNTCETCEHILFNQGMRSISALSFLHLQ